MSDIKSPYATALSARTNTICCLSPPVVWSSAAGKFGRATVLLSNVSVRSTFNVTNSGLSGRGDASALAAGKLTAISTVASGAAIMKIMRSTSITSMNGVTLISCSSRSASSPWSRRALTDLLRRRGGASSVGRPTFKDAAIEVATDEANDRGGGVAVKGTVASAPARIEVVHDNCRNRRYEAESGRQQSLGDAGRNDRQIGRVLLGNTNEAVHDAPYRTEQSDKWRGGSYRGKKPGATNDLTCGSRFKAFKSRRNAFLQARSG